ncbi:MAG: OmpA family protein [Flavobacteriales bacterium]|jgi:outer membrane protein OmpA-like peptidoglycan-associated protein|nr:OmpA family protein [Flavobacteriales bacterium]
MTDPRTLLIGALLALPAALPAQGLVQRLQHDTMPNLVPDPGFEVYRAPLCGWTQDVEKFNRNLTHWSSPTQTTPDLFSTRNDPGCWGHPAKHSGGRQGTRNGHGMAGIKTYGKGNTPTYWHEYLQTELGGPLQAGVRYIAECWVMRAVKSNEASNNIGMLFTDAPVATRDNLPLHLTPQVNEEKVVRKNGWHKVRGVFEATGTERYLLIGNFYGDDATRHERMPQGERGAYYYVDDVNVRVAPPGTALTPRPKESAPPPPRPVVPDHSSSNEVAIHTVEPAVGTRIRLDNVQFAFDKADLLPGHEKELGELVDLMTDFPFLRVEIEGHTDDQGSDAYNDRLSEARARAVADFLIGRKVAASRITAKGYGERQPLVPNTSEEHRAINRRVEFRVVER